MSRKNRGCEGAHLMFTNALMCRRIPSGASQPIGIFHTLRKGVKTIYMGLLGRRSLSPCVCLPHTTCFLLAPLCLSTCYAGYSMLVTNLLINFVSCLTEETSPTPEDSHFNSLLASSPFMWNAKRALRERVSKR